MTLRSNRITIPVKTKISTIMAIVRGQNIPGTMRMAAVVVEEVRRDPNILQDAGAFDWENMWRRKVSKYELDYNPENWVSLHIGGEQIFSSREENAAIQQVEALAAGDDVTDAIVSEAAANIIGALEDLVVEHDTQTAFVFSAFPAYLRAAILERRDRKTGSYAISAYHPSPQRPVRLSHFISFCADMAEALTHKSFLDRVQELIATNAIGNAGITPALVQATRNRRRDLTQQIENFEGANKVVYRPERPSLA
ncbi:MAG: hypothetical protein IT566_07240 [Rhodospirillaceae bacterium]|nr:hypothetical protein [Rhodospirillaceae bacterium]